MQIRYGVKYVHVYLFLSIHFTALVLYLFKYFLIPASVLVLILKYQVRVLLCEVLLITHLTVLKYNVDISWNACTCTSKVLVLYLSTFKYT